MTVHDLWLGPFHPEHDFDGRETVTIEVNGVEVLLGAVMVRSGAMGRRCLLVASSEPFVSGWARAPEDED